MILFTARLDKCKKWYHTYHFSQLCENQSRFIQFFTYRKNNDFLHVIILTKSVFNKHKNSYFYNIFLETSSYELPKRINFCVKYK